MDRNHVRVTLTNLLAAASHFAEYSPLTPSSFGIIPMQAQNLNTLEQYSSASQVWTSVKQSQLLSPSAIKPSWSAGIMAGILCWLT